MRNQYDTPDFVDVWIFNSDAVKSDLIYQPDEVSDAKWADKDTILNMIYNGEMVAVYTYLDEVFNFSIN
jgi:isopentenyldiphosphate isomerase